jgi:hypothetical protein
MPTLGAIRVELIYALLLTAVAFLFTPQIDSSCPIIPYMLLYIIVIAVQVPFSYDFDTSWDIFIDRIIKFAFMAFFIVAFVRSPTHLKFFLGAFLLACLKMGQEGLIGRITGGLIWENQGIMRLHGATPMYEHPNSFAGMALGTLPFIYYLWPLSNKYVRAVLILLGLLSLNIVIYTGSRTGYIGLFALIAYIFVNSKAKGKFAAWVIIISLIALPLIPSDYVGRFESIFSGKDKEGQSTEARIEILKDAWQIFEQNPLGVGVGAFPKKRFETFGRSQDTHNLYLEIATNLGIQGLIIVGLLIYKLMQTLQGIRVTASDLIRKLRDSDIQPNKFLLNDLSLIKAVASATSAFIVIRLALGLFGMDLYEIYWWFALGLTFSLYSMLNRIQMTAYKWESASPNDRK